MFKARIGKEVIVRVRNEIGVVAQLTRLIADKGADAVVRFVTSDNLRVMDALRERHYNPREKDVVLLVAAHKPGMLRHITDTLARENIDLRHLYASSADEQDKCLMVFDCGDNDRAVVLLA
jgi:hypothetical protein